MKHSHGKGAPDAIDLGALEISISDYASQGNAILGIRDSGKSYTATYLAEQLLKAGVPFVAFDPIGVWRFLGHAGKGAGFPIIVAGENADLPLTPDNCEAIVTHAMEKNVPLVLDLYAMALSKADWRRIVERSVRLLLYKNKAHGLRHIFIEEAAEFCPQIVQREYGTVYAEVEKLARMGGNAMLGYTLINQRAEQVNKAVLELCDCVFLHRQKGRLSISALNKWIEVAIARTGIIQRMPMLEQGECFVWANGRNDPTPTKIPTKRTFHPNRRAHSTPGERADFSALLDGLELPAGDEEDLSIPLAMTHAAPAEKEIQRVPVFETGDIAKLELAVREVRESQREFQTAVAEFDSVARSLEKSLHRANDLQSEPLRRAPEPKPKRIAGERTPPEAFGSGHRAILATLAARMPARLTMAQLGTLSGYTNSTLRTYLPAIRDAGFIDENADGMMLNAHGRGFLGTDLPKMPRGGRALLDFWMPKLTLGEAKILENLFTHRGVMSMEQLERVTGYTASTLRTYLPTLRRNNLIDPTELRIMPEFLES